MSKEIPNKDEKHRPEPEALLKIAAEEESQEIKKRGKLTIFLGYCAGVGKTYTMLEAINRRVKENLDAVIGYVETHKRKETDALLQGLTIIPRTTYQYKGTTIQEMDLDAILLRKPQLATVDELAHTNAPGARHSKRYKDVEELLAAGIDVYTTLNIQHLESLNDVVAKITGIKTRETIPDKVLEKADEIVVVDVAIPELLQRIREGKVYIRDQAIHAIQNFFNEGNLTALRELTLRRAAKRVDAEMQRYVQRHSITGPMASSERLLVCVSTLASGTELVRSGSLLATGLDATWSVIHVESSQVPLPSKIDQNNLSKTLELAQELGAQIIQIDGNDIAAEIVNYAKEENVTKIIIGKPHKFPWYKFYKSSIVDQLIAASTGIDVHVIDLNIKTEERPEIQIKTSFAWHRYFYSLILIALTTFIGTQLLFSKEIVLLFYATAIILSAIFFGLGPSIFAVIVSIFTFDYVFDPHQFSINIFDLQFLTTASLTLATCALINYIVNNVRRRFEAFKLYTRKTSSLYGLSRDLTIAVDTNAIFKAAHKHINQLFHCSTAFFLKEKNSLKTVMIDKDFPWDAREKSVASWVLQNSDLAGWNTDTLPGAASMFLPIHTNQGIFGVVGINFKNKTNKINPTDKDLLHSFISQISLAIERAYLVDELRQSLLMREKEVIQTALFDSVSRDLHTPLILIKDLLNELINYKVVDEKSRHDLLLAAFDETKKMKQLIDNLLDMARLESGAFKLVITETNIKNLIHTAVSQFKTHLTHRKVTINVSENLPHVPLDFSFMLKVITNLIDNAIRYSDIHLPIDIDCSLHQDFLEIKIQDKGIGIPADDLEHIFDKFYRVKRPQSYLGTGLGLSICRHIVTAHKGKIWAENRIGGGSIFFVHLPLSKTNKQIKPI